MAASALVVLCTAGRGHQADLLTAQTAPADLGLPADAAALGSTVGPGSDPSFWHTWQQRLEREEERVEAWRERQRSAVREDTAAEQAAARATAQQRWNSGVQAAREAVSAAVTVAAAAAAADPLLDADEALARRSDPELPSDLQPWDLQLPAAGGEQQEPLAAGVLGGSAGALAAEERR